MYAFVQHEGPDILCGEGNQEHIKIATVIDRIGIINYSHNRNHPFNIYKYIFTSKLRVLLLPPKLGCYLL